MVSLIPRQPAKVFFFHFSAENLNCQMYLTISHTMHTPTHTGMQIVRQSQKTMMYVLLVWRETC